jgi:hypothetical protein
MRYRCHELLLNKRSLDRSPKKPEAYVADPPRSILIGGEDEVEQAVARQLARNGIGGAKDEVPGELSANRKASGFYGGISPVKSASRQEIKH